MGDVFPRRDLPGKADAWGRNVELRIVGAEGKTTQVEQTLNNVNRGVSGQLAVISQQIDALGRTVGELANRRTLSTSPADLSVTGSATIEPFPTATRTFSLPAPAGTRAATVGVSANLSNSGGNTNPVNVFVELLYGATVVARTDGSVPRAASAPSGWNPTVNFFTFLTVPPDSDPQFSIRITRVGFTATSTTVTMSNINAFIQYGDLV